MVNVKSRACPRWLSVLYDISLELLERLCVDIIWSHHIDFTFYLLTTSTRRTRINKNIYNLQTVYQYANITVQALIGINRVWSRACRGQIIIRFNGISEITLFYVCLFSQYLKFKKCSSKFIWVMCTYDIQFPITCLFERVRLILAPRERNRVTGVVCHNGTEN